MHARRRTAVALRHIAFEDLGLLAPILNQAGWDLVMLDAPIDDLSDPALETAELLIVLGGPIGVYDVDDYPFLNREVALIERRLAKLQPTLGICLGCQLMAKALGSRVFQGGIREIGWGHVELTQQGRSSCLRPLADEHARVLHWHGDTFDLPKDAVRLAFNAHYENQAFSYGNSLALQFHLEADPTHLEQWYVGHAVELAAAGISVAQLRAATIALGDRVQGQARDIFELWLQETDSAANSSRIA
jgi:GMP synthase (glutamine-hydrolysing)